jgi:N,N'-diacetyllegionaminate synthase
MVRGIRIAERARGEAVKRPSTSELEIAAVARRSLHWSRSMRVGDTVAPDDVLALRPGTGLSPAHLGEVIGSQVIRPAAAGAVVRLDDLEPTTKHGR